MGLKIKTFQDSLKGMVDWIAQYSTRLVDFSVGSTIRTLLESVSSELEDFYFKMYKNFVWAQENSLYEAFDFTRRSAVSAYGLLTINFSEKTPTTINIPAGTKFATSLAANDVLYFVTTKAYIISKSSLTADIEVVCTVSGTIGNVSADTIKLMTNSIPYVSTVSNKERFITGKEQETLAERKSRFVDFIKTRARGTRASLEYGTREVPQIDGVYIDESTPGMVRVYCHDGAGNLSDELKVDVQNNLINYKVAGVPLFVLPTVKRVVDVEVTISVLYQFNTDDFKNYLISNIQTFFDRFIDGQMYIESDFNSYVRNIDKVAIKNNIVLKPTGDFAVEVNEIIRLGALTVNLETSV